MLKLILPQLPGFGGPVCLPSLPGTSCSTRTPSPSSEASSRSSSCQPGLSLPSNCGHRLPRPMSRSSSSSSKLSTGSTCKSSSSSSNSSTVSAGKLPALLNAYKLKDKGKLVAHLNVHRLQESLASCKPQDERAPKVVCRSLRQRGSSGKVLPLTHNKPLPEASDKSTSAKRSHSHSGVTIRVTDSKRDVANEESQAQAIEALVVEMSSRKSLEDVIHSLCRHVLRCDGARAFPKHLQQLVCSARISTDAHLSVPQRGAPQEEQKAVGPLAVQVLRDLACKAGLSFGDVAGQILWHFRKTDVLTNDVIMSATAKDLTWVDLASRDMGPKPSAVVEKAFQQHANENGRVDERALLQMMDQWWHVYQDRDDSVPEFTDSKASFSRTDLNRFLFEQASCRLTCNGLKSLLVKLAHTMSMHPALVFMNTNTASRAQ